ncbi:unnamed protein product [Oreochromis niloticus]|nr:unnamed protein product [Mustela putorius furo]CAI5692052.1 unnamed protein product [Mustela putorius furo]
MALLSLQPLAVFLDCPGELKIPFAASKKLFDNYLLAIGGNDFATERKRALLIHCLGTEGQRIYSALPLTTDDYEGSVKALETYFHPKVNVVAERYRFRQRAQSVELKNLEEHGIIEKIDASEWVSPIVVTRRKTGDIRMCVDLREPNKGVVVDSHPLPLIEDILSELRGAVMFSTLDLKSAYHQLKLHEESRGLTAFITHEGLYQYCTVPYGLSSAPALFQKMMTQILRGQKGMQCYLDDVIIYGASEAEHEANLHAVLYSINNAGLKLNVDKCQLHQTTLSFLGQKIGPEGLLPDDSHVTLILQPCANFLA